MTSGNTAKIAVALVLFAGAAFGFYRFFHQRTGVSERAFFYDLSEKKLFAAPREALPPIRGINDAQEDGVRAVVICTAGEPDNPSNQSIAYLEKYAPELKLNIEQARAGKAEPMPSKVRNGYRLVKRPQDDKWQAANSPEGQVILNGWNVALADGKFPIVCSP
jgi:hypothetical protein